jgi:predicted SprT family Zn-dependent metalloprotease
MDIFKVEALAKSLIHKHLEGHKEPYGFDWLCPKMDYTILGACCFENKKIMLNSRFCYAEGEQEIVKVILHEIAHALVGPKAGHGKFFVKKCREIGLMDKKYIGETVEN